MTKPFEFVNAINYTKEYLFNDPQSEKDYNSFLVNRSLSYFVDTIMFASEMNRYPQLTNKQQFDYYINIIARKKRFSKWAEKESKSDNLDAVCSYYGYSKQRGKDVLDMLSSEQIKFIKEKQYTGGRK
jgi:hypothetical protein